MNQNNVVVAIDLGSHTFKIAIGEYDHEQSLHLRHLEEIPSEGLKKGAIINKEKVINTLNKLLVSTMENSGFSPKAVYVAYSSENIEALNSTGVTAIGLRGKGRLITEEDKTNVINAVQAIVIGEDKEIAHIIPLSYVVDNQEHVKEPLNMVGVRLEAEAHIVIAPASLLDNINSAIQQADLSVIEMIYSPLASAQAVLSVNERQKGTIYLDVGSATTKISFFQYGEPYFNTVLPIGAHSLTTDLAYMLKIDDFLAEQIKINHGCCYHPLLERDDYAYIPGNADRGPEPVSEHYICDILAARMADILNGAKNILEHKGWMAQASGIVIGGGGSNLPGCCELVSRIFNLPAHTAVCGMGFENLTEEQRGPQYGTVLGLLKRPVGLSTYEPVEKSLYARHNSPVDTEKKENKILRFFHSITKDIF